MIPTCEASVAPKLPPYVKRVKNRTGRTYCYLILGRGTDRQQKAVRLPDITEPDFWSEYAKARNLPQEKPRTDTFAALVTAWHASPEWRALGAGTKREWLRHCGRILEQWGDLQVRGLEPRHVLHLRDQYSRTPASSNNMLRCLSSMLGWSVPRGWRPDNPCREVRPLKGGAGYAPWPWDVIEAAERELRPDLWWAVALALYTGQRQGDCLAMRWNAITPQGIAVTQQKTGKALLIPVHKRLAEVLDQIPRRAVTVLTNTDGRPWQGFQTAWNKHKPQLVRERGLVFHGLRKSAVVTLLEAGCTEAEVSAITGQSLAMVAHYARQVNQRHLAAAAILKWENAERTETGNTVGNTERLK